MSEVVTDVLQSPAVSVLITLEAEGFVVSAAGDRLKVKPISKLTPEQRGDLERYRDELLVLLRVCDKEVQTRRAAFAQQLESGVNFGLLVIRPGIPYVPGVCYSCAERLPHPRPGRCWRCALAARLACHAPIAVELMAEYDEARSA